MEKDDHIAEAALQRLAVRVERLARLLTISAPRGVIAREAWLIFEAAVLLDHEAAGEMMFERLYTLVRMSAGFCSTCSAKVPLEGEPWRPSPNQSHPPQCPECVAREERELKQHGWEDADEESEE
jgi:hypothetical protein